MSKPTITVITCNQIEGYHCWPDAVKHPTIAYLADKHRHVFDIECHFKVKHDDRQIEIIQQQHLIEALIRDRHGIPAEFHDMSCEAIAREIMDYFPACVRATVREDGMGGAMLER